MAISTSSSGLREMSLICCGRLCYTLEGCDLFAVCTMPRTDIYAKYKNTRKVCGYFKYEMFQYLEMLFTVCTTEIKGL